MKIHIEVEMTPQELREFFGLPDVQDLQADLVQRLRQGIEAGTEGFDPAVLLRPLLPDNLQALEAMQKAFWAGMAAPSEPSED